MERRGKSRSDERIMKRNEEMRKSGSVRKRKSTSKARACGETQIKEKEMIRNREWNEVIGAVVK